MQPSPTSSFVRSVIGFAIFLGVSFGVTYGVNTLTAKQSQEKQVATAIAGMLKKVK